MQNQDFTTTILVDQSPDAVFRAVSNPRAWWSEEIEGSTDQLNGVFDYHFEDIHRCRLKVTELVPGKKVVWYVMDNYFKPGIFFEQGNAGSSKGHSGDTTEWTGTFIHFDITEKDNQTQLRFTHEGLVPAYECFDVCVNGWTHYIRQSLFGLITTGTGEPNRTGTPQTAAEVKIKAGKA
jgi:uncharacterized protein YndB with AHSA1/START domain